MEMSDPHEKSNEPLWKSDLVKRIWEYARASGVVVVDVSLNPSDACRERLPEGLSVLVRNIRNRCDRCGRPGKRVNVEGIIARALADYPVHLSLQTKIGIAQKIDRVLIDFGLDGFELDTYQCCRIETDQESYVPKLCIDCHNDLKKTRPHATISV